ncbi:MAG: DsbA family protein [Crocinitomicaceae bacterium]
MNFDWLKNDANALIYVGDTMCSWCYGFANNLDDFISAHPELKLHLVQGGLRPNNVEKAIDMADFLKEHWVEINKRTNQPFSYDILSDPNFVYDTEPASRAVVVVRMIDPSKELAFFKAVQTAFYHDNKNTNQLETYLEIAKKMAIDVNKFAELFESDEAKYNTKADFQLSSEMGVKGFPTTIIKKGKEFIMLSNGYRELEDLELVYAKIMG